MPRTIPAMTAAAREAENAAKDRKIAAEIDAGAQMHPSCYSWLARQTPARRERAIESMIRFIKEAKGSLIDISLQTDKDLLREVPAAMEALKERALRERASRVTCK